jgi:hypothetical protein
MYNSSNINFCKIPNLIVSQALTHWNFYHGSKWAKEILLQFQDNLY